MSCFAPVPRKSRHRRHEEEKYAPRVKRSQNSLGVTTTTISCKVPPHIYNPPNSPPTRAWDYFKDSLNSNANANNNAFNANSQAVSGFGGGSGNGDGFLGVLNGGMHGGRNGNNLQSLGHGAGIATYVPIREQVYGRRPSSLVHDVEGIQKLQTRLQEAINPGSIPLNSSNKTYSTAPGGRLKTPEDVTAAVNAALKEERETHDRENTKADLKRVLEQQRKNAEDLGTMKLDRTIEKVRDETRMAVLKEIGLGSEDSIVRERSRERRREQERHLAHLHLLTAAERKRSEGNHIHYHSPPAPAPVIIPQFTNPNPFHASAAVPYPGYAHPQPYTYASSPPVPRHPHAAHSTHHGYPAYPYGGAYAEHRKSSLVGMTAHEVTKLVGRLGRVEDVVLGSEILAREREGRLGLGWRDERDGRGWGEGFGRGGYR